METSVLAVGHDGKNRRFVGFHSGNMPKQQGATGQLSMSSRGGSGQLNQSSPAFLQCTENKQASKQTNKPNHVCCGQSFLGEP